MNRSRDLRSTVERHTEKRNRYVLKALERLTQETDARTEQIGTYLYGLQVSGSGSGF